MVLFVILSVVVLLVILIMAARLKLLVDTRSHYYSMSWGVLVSGMIEPVQEDLLLVLRILGLRFRWSVMRMIARAASDSDQARVPGIKVQPRAKTKRKQKKFSRKHLDMGLRVIKSFKVRRFHMDIDTDDYTTNALLYPALTLAPADINVNFNGVNELDLEVENRAFNILKALIR